jgi:hypothetical protein
MILAGRDAVTDERMAMKKITFTVPALIGPDVRSRTRLPVEVEGYALDDDWAVHHYISGTGEVGKRWVVTHIPSGRRVPDVYDTRWQAIAGYRDYHADGRLAAAVALLEKEKK